MSKIKNIIKNIITLVTLMLLLTTAVCGFPHNILDVANTNKTIDEPSVLLDTGLTTTLDPVKEDTDVSETNDKPVVLLNTKDVTLVTSNLIITLDPVKDNTAVSESIVFKNTNIQGVMETKIDGTYLKMSKFDISDGKSMPIYASQDGKTITWPDVIGKNPNIYHLQYITGVKYSKMITSPSQLVLNVPPNVKMLLTDENGKQITSTPVIGTDFATYRWENPTFTMLNVEVAPVSNINPIPYMILALILSALVYHICRYRVPIGSYITKINIRKMLNVMNRDTSK